MSAGITLAKSISCSTKTDWQKRGSKITAVKNTASSLFIFQELQDFLYGLSADKNPEDKEAKGTLDNALKTKENIK